MKQLDIIAKTLLEVETLDAEQIKHLVDHGTLPERKVASTKIDASTKDVKVNIMKKDEDPIEGTNPIAEKHSSNDEIANAPKDNPDNRIIILSLLLKRVLIKRAPFFYLSSEYILIKH